MKTRILPSLALLPLLAACVEAPDTPPTEEAPVVEAAAAPAQQVAAAPARTAPAPTPAPAARAVPEPTPTPAAPAPATPVSNVTTPPATAPQPRAVLGAAPPPAATPETEVASAEPAPAAPAPAAGRLGTTVASLGSPTKGGLWLETPLVEAARTGRIEYNGQTVTVELRPSGGEPGSGSQISVEAMRALGAPLTSLPELTVFAG